MTATATRCRKIRARLRSCATADAPPGSGRRFRHSMELQTNLGDEQPDRPTDSAVEADRPRRLRRAPRHCTRYSPGRSNRRCGLCARGRRFRRVSRGFPSQAVRAEKPDQRPEDEADLLRQPGIVARGRLVHRVEDIASPALGDGFRGPQRCVQPRREKVRCIRRGPSPAAPCSVVPRARRKPAECPRCTGNRLRGLRCPQKMGRRQKVAENLPSTIAFAAAASLAWNTGTMFAPWE